MAKAMPENFDKELFGNLTGTLLVRLLAIRFRSRLY